MMTKIMKLKINDVKIIGQKKDTKMLPPVEFTWSI